MIQKIVLFVVISIVTSFSLQAYSDSTSVGADTTSDDRWFRFDDEVGLSRFKNFSLKLDSNERGMLELSYGQMITKHDNYTQSLFTPLGSLNVKIGYFKSSQQGSRRYKLPFYDYEGLLNFSYNSVDVGGEKSETKIEGKQWEFSFADREALGYDLGKDVAIMPYYQNSTLFWGGYSFRYDTTAPDELNRFTQGLRFGHGNEAGIMIQCTENIALTGSYSFNTLFPRHIFWQWAVSEIVYQAGDALADGFVKIVKRRAPFAAPILHFILRNGLAYGMYELRKKGMNWPFDSEKALGMEQFRVGVTFMF